MTRPSHLTALLILAGALHSGAGTLSYVAVSPVQSDINCGIDSRTQYTTAVDGGNASGNDRVINGVRLYSLSGSGQSAAADNCVLNALTGTLANSQRSNGAPQADGIFAETISDMISNEGAADNSQQEIVLDPASLTAGTTYDLRLYIANSGAQDREVNLAFVGDGQAPVETGFFNEDDARTSPGAFRDPNQLYYIDYQFTWDGASTPGVTITQKSGQAPFVLYAMTNQPVTEEVAAAPAPPAAPVAPAPAAVTTGLVSAVPDQVGVTSDTFYSNESLKKHGRWIEVKKYGRCWQPTDSPPDWRPYSRGHFAFSDDGGYVWISDSSENEWGWACYHYGRWCRVPGVGSGWAWVPGTAWSGGWVSWRQGRDREHAFVGWAPLPPEATLRVGVGISTWADREYDIGPDYYTFINVKDFGSDSYWRPGLIVDRRRYVDILPHTINITNINYTNTNGNVSNVTITQVRAYNGGPDFTFINTEIRQRGGREISRIRVDRVGNENFNGAAGSQLQGNTFIVFTPHVKREANPAVLPQVAATVPDNKIDHGWADVKNAKVQAQLRNDIAQQTKGQTPATTKAVLPPQVIQAAAQSAATTASPGQPPQTPGTTTIPTTSPSATAAGQVAGTGSPPQPTSPAQSPSGAVANTAPSPSASQPITAAKGLHPGEKLTSPAVATGRATPPSTGSATPPSRAAVTSALPAETQASTPPKILHPGAKVEAKPSPSPGVAANAASPSATAGAAQSPAARGQHPGEKIVSAPAQSAAPIRTASPTIPPKSAAIATPQATPAPAVGLHPGAKIASTPAQTSTPGVAGTNAPPARNAQTRGAVTAASASPTPQLTPPVVGRQSQPRGRAENKAPVTPTPSQAQVASTPVQLPVTARTPARSGETVQTPPPVQTPAVTKKVTAPAVTREPTSPAPSGPSQQQLQAIEEQKRQQQIEERMRQQQQQKQQEQVEQKVQQQQTQQRQQQLEQQKLEQQEQQQAQQRQQQLEQEQKSKQQAQQKAEQAQAKQQEAAQQKERQLQQQKQQQLQQQQAEQKQLKQQELKQQQALQRQQEAAQQKQQQAQQLKEQQAQQRQQELKQQQAQQLKEQQQQAKQQQLQQQQAEQQRLRQQQQQAEQQRLRQQQQQAEQQQQRQQQQQQNRRAATPTPTPS